MSCKNIQIKIMFYREKKAECLFELITLNREKPHLLSVLARTCVVCFLRSTSMKSAVENCLAERIV